MGSGLDEMIYYKENSVVQNGADPRDVDIVLKGKIVVGKFSEKKRPTFLGEYEENILKKFRRTET
jgi:hypothetical protein